LSEGTRRLAAIMFTDLVGYSALSQKNEDYALELLEEHRKLVRPFFSKHDGREIKTVGDAFLVEFASALEAVRCAFDIQQSLHELNIDRPAEKKVLLRIGVHLGDVIHSQNDVYGDSVNVASRIEPLAEPGGICVTEQVYDHVKNKFEFPLVSLGKRELKNVGESNEVFKMVLPWQRESQNKTDFDEHRLAVLPLSSISPDPKDAYFADGMTEELITVLSQLKGLRVIARTSVDHYKGREKRVSQIAQELQVGSIIEGGVRLAQDRIRVTIQLINARSEEHIWSESYDRKLDDIFGIQTDIAKQVAQSLKMKLIGEERARLNARTTENISAYVNYLKGRSLLSTKKTDEVKRAKELFESTIAEDPKYAPAFVGLADTYRFLGYWFVLPFQSALQKAKELVSSALELDPNLAEAHASLGRILDHDYDFGGAETEFRKAIALNPSYANAHVWYSFLLMDLGKYQQAIEELRLAEDADPLSLDILNNEVHYFSMIGRKEEAASSLKKVLELYPENRFVRWNQSIFDALNGDYERAITILKDLSKSEPLDPVYKTDLAIVHADIGDMENARITLRELLSIPEETTWTMGIACVYAALGDGNEFFAYANRAFEKKKLDFGILRLMLRWVPGGRKILGDPRLSELFRRVDLNVQTDIV
jgi:adenylate cyclase